MFSFRLWDGLGKKKAAGVTKDNELCTILAPYPALVQQKVRPFRQYLTDDGTAQGSNAMGVNGSTTNVDFYISADPKADRYITSLNFIVAYGSSSAPYKFADVAALANGSRVFYTSKAGEQDIHEGIKTNQDLFRLSFGNTPALWEVRHVNAANDYGYFISSDITKMGIPYGVKLDRGTNQKLIIRIRDDVSGADTFDCIAYGFDRFE